MAGTSSIEESCVDDAFVYCHDSKCPTLKIELIKCTLIHHLYLAVVHTLNRSSLVTVEV